ncbi:MAG: type II toxin-antitoxin system HicA family toxin [Chitinophagales bacterium]
MKRKEFVRHLNNNQCLLKREGGSHSVYLNISNNKTSTVPRHNEINDYLVKKICKDLDIKAP